MPWATTKYELSPPPLDELAAVLQTGLQQHFESVSVLVTRSPDLREAPFHLAAAGISGRERIGDVGGPQNLRPLPRLDHKYHLREIMDRMEMQDGLVIGAGAGPFHHVGGNTELMPNLSYTDGVANNQTRFARIVPATETDSVRDIATGTLAHRCRPLPAPKSTDSALLTNLYGSDGAPGDVLKIVAHGRKPDSPDFTAAIQSVLRSTYNQPVSLGGVFVLRRGRALLHVMSDFKTEPRLPGNKDNWLKFFDVAAPLTCLSVVHTLDPGLRLHLEHTHCFSERGEGGHFHHDSTPADAEYEAYFNTAKVIYRIDAPGE
ncbi:hypothetical protein HMPREF1624_00240 [Sporothrix schenckii ATCC 58251]|uniref:DUF1907 domain-containing protein n=1 Tax=Sporothrix schenckii (strain ATCC 58251 / de Perez 2211183) TaxID=1391915 RepID=U7Q4M5_SPOS1|nr:hypothetical protein HMPREF1624_00240 [Sporothrix schenckii ATCC 58251]